MGKTNKLVIIVLLLLFNTNWLQAQQGFGTNKPSKASVIDMKSESKGLLIPNVKLNSLTNFLPLTGEIATNTTKVNSLLVYNTATVGTTIKPGYYYWTTDGTSPNSFWKRLLANDDLPSKTLTGSGITVTAGSTVGTGTSLDNTVLADVTLGIADDAVNSSKIANASVQGEDLNANVAGTGLKQAVNGALQVNANNGLTVAAAADAVQLGGNLIKPTTITTTNSYTLAIAGLQPNIVTDNIMMVDATSGVLRKAKSVMPKFFYMPSIVFDISVVGTFNRNLYNEYINQFGTPMISSAGATEGIPTLLAGQLEYYITYYDTNIFENLSIDQNGLLTYKVKNSNASTQTFMNIVFVVKNN